MLMHPHRESFLATIAAKGHLSHLQYRTTRSAGANTGQGSAASVQAGRRRQVYCAFQMAPLEVGAKPGVKQEQRHGPEVAIPLARGPLEETS